MKLFRNKIKLVGFKLLNGFKLGMGILMVIWSGACFGQTQYDIQTSGSYEGYYEPIGAYYGYQRYATVYQYSQITSAGGDYGNITHISFEVGSSGSATIPTKIYLKETSSTEVSFGTWSAKTSGATLVYNSSQAYNSTGWVQFDITDFNYTADNLMVLVESNYGGYGTSSRPYFKSLFDGDASRLWRRDSSEPTDNGSPTDYQANFKCTSEPLGPTISTSGTLTSFSACQGTNSTEQSFSVSADYLTNNISITPPTGYEISETSGSGFTSSITLTQSGGTVGSTTIYVRTTTSASNGDGGNIVCSSTGATTVNVATGSATISMGTIYVNDNSTSGDVFGTSAFDGSGDGTIGDPFNTLADALAAAGCPTGATIYIDAGTYNDELIDITSSHDGLTLAGAGNSLTIFEQSGTGDHFMEINSSATNIIIKDIKIKGYDENNNGGAIDITTSGTVTIQDCHFDGNSTTSSYDEGAAISTANATTTIKRCIFSNNTTSNNTSVSIVYTEGGMTMENCLFYDNSAASTDYSGIVKIDNGTNTITNCTFTENTGGDVVYIWDGNTTYIKNCLFYNNTGSYDVEEDNTYSDYPVMLNCYYESRTGSFDTGSESGNLTSGTVGFTDAASNDFSIASNSVCVDAGTSSGASSDDILGTTRDGSPDIGAYEYYTINWTGATSTAWATSTNWDSGVTPTSSQSPIIPDVSGASGNFPVITTAVTLGGITVNSSASLTVTSNSLTVSGAIDCDGTLNIDNATVNGDGAVDFTNGTIDFTNASGKLILSSTSTSLGTLDATMGTVEYDGGTQTVLSDNYFNLEIDAAGTKTAGGAINVDGNLSTAATAGCKLDMGAYSLNIAGNLTVEATDGLDLSDASSLVTFDGSSDQTITHAGNASGSLGATQSEGFESGSGSWTVDNSGSFDWTRKTTGTPSSGTGPVQAHAGSYYYYTEATSGSTGDDDYITQTFDFSGYASPQMTFYYHMYGSAMGTLYIEVNTGGGWSALQTISGQQHTSNHDSWTQSTVDLSAYAGNASTQVRFHGERGSSYTSDMAIDAVEISDAGPAPSGSEFNDLTINNSGGDVDLSSAISVEGTVTFTSGFIDASSNTITFLVGSSASGANSSSHVKGTIDYMSESTTPFIFPIGDGSDYEPFTVTPNSTSANTWRLSYSATDQGDRNMGTGMAEVSQSEYFDLSRQSGSNGAVIAFNWDANDNVDTYTDLEIAHFTGGQWEVVASTPVGTNTSGTLTSDAALTSFSPFAKGSSSSGNLLPVDLLSFEAECQDNGVELTWVTASEENNDYFILEKSQDTQDYEEIAQVMGSGTATIMNEYGHFDYASVDNQLYYRLSQVDFDGQSDVFNPISVNCSVEKEKSQLFIAGNKMNGSIKVQSTVSENQFYDLSVFDASGKQVYTGQGFTESGEIDDQLFIYTQATGIYIVQMVVDGQLYSEKLVW